MKKLFFLATIILAFLYIFTWCADFILCHECGIPYAIDTSAELCSFCMNFNLIPNFSEIFLCLFLMFIITYYCISVPSATVSPLYEPPRF